MNANKHLFKIALIGNPNSGKSSLFNTLTGLQQHVANFPGVTVDKKTSVLKLNGDTKILLTDFPGAYSLYPNSDDERIVTEILTNPLNPDYPDAIIYVADPFDLKRQMLLFTQIKDLKIPVLLVITMKDLAESRKLNLNIEKLIKFADNKVCFISNKSKDNKDDLKSMVYNLTKSKSSNVQFYKLSEEESDAVHNLSNILNGNSDYQKLLEIHHSDWLKSLDKTKKIKITDYKESNAFNSIPLQINETLTRFRSFDKNIKSLVNTTTTKRNLKNITDKIDLVVTNRYFGPFLFFLIMFLVFQAIFSWAAFPMDMLENGFLFLSDYIKNNFSYNWFTGLLADGIIPGLAGVLVFIPQIFILFLVVGIMEETGYMSRVIFMFDDIMRKFGMNGRSLIALISGGACSVPAIMSTRTINNWKERLITIMVTPLISCSARLPVFSLLVLFAVPDEKIGFFNLRGLTLMGLYFSGIIMALISAFIMKYFINSRGSSFLIISMPEYKMPSIKNIGYYLKNKLGAFVFGAGKIIFLISIVLWFLASYGPGKNMKIAEEEALNIAMNKGFDKNETDNLIASKKLENSYIGILGKTIEPTIKPLGFDWKIGIALITSFAAREVFVGTMATIYSLGSVDDNMKISKRMEADINRETGLPYYNRAVAWSLLVFYLFALQCLSTLAIVYKETRSIKWPLLQFLYMGGLAYFFSYMIFNILK